mmetsp:Transcript_97024/g.151623  ORF Transcript_97024/g.151623 Transcript_97024/m.151623 type:complete len:221 (+) Transcript_97024:456-1118(+)
MNTAHLQRCCNRFMCAPRLSFESFHEFASGVLGEDDDDTIVAEMSGEVDGPVPTEIKPSSDMPRPTRNWSELEALDELAVNEGIAMMPGLSEENTFATLLQLTGGRQVSIAGRSNSRGESLPARPLAFATSREFVVRLKRGARKLNLDVDNGDGSALRVTNIRPGIIAEWNATHPEEQIEVGDVLVEINGIRGSASKLLEEVAAAPKLNILVLKAPCVSA